MTEKVEESTDNWTGIISGEADGLKLKAATEMQEHIRRTLGAMLKDVYRRREKKYGVGLCGHFSAFRRKREKTLLGHFCFCFHDFLDKK